MSYTARKIYAHNGVSYAVDCKNCKEQATHELRIDYSYWQAICSTCLELYVNGWHAGYLNRRAK